MKSKSSGSFRPTRYFRNFRLVCALPTVLWILATTVLEAQNPVGATVSAQPEPESGWEQFGLAKPNPNAPYAKPPRLELLFEDIFISDTRVDYEVEGEPEAVGWEPGKLTLGDGTRLARRLDSEDWIELQLDLQFPELTKEGQKSELKIKLDFQSATESYLILRQRRIGGKTKSEVVVFEFSVLDPNSSAWQLPEKIRSQPLGTPLPSGRWKIEYRFGVWLVASPHQEAVLIADINRGQTLVKGVCFSNTGCSIVASGISARGFRGFAGKFTDAQVKELAAVESLNDQVLELYEQGRSADALPLARQAAVITLGVQGLYHQDAALSLLNLASQFHKLERFSEAEQLYLLVVRIHKELLGPEHPEYSMSLNNLAGLYIDVGAYPAAEEAYFEALGIQEALFGREHEDYALVLNNLASLYLECGNFVLAEKRLMEALEVRERIGSSADFGYAASLNALAGLYLELGDSARAEPLFRRSREISEQTIGRTHPQFATILHAQARFYTGMGDYLRAEPLLLEARRINEEHWGEEHGHYADSLEHLAALYGVTREYQRAEPLYLEALRIRENLLGKRHPGYASALHNLGVLYSYMEQHEKAQGLLLEARQIQEQALPQNHPDSARSLGNLAFECRILGDFVQAESFYLEARAILQASLGLENREYAANCRDLAFLYEASVEYAKAEPLFAEAAEIALRQLEKTSLVQSESQQLFMLELYRPCFDSFLSFALRHASAQPKAIEILWEYKGKIAARQSAMRRALYSLDRSEQELVNRLQRAASQLSAESQSTSSEVAQLAARRERIGKLQESYEQLQRELSRVSVGFRQTLAAAELPVAALVAQLPADAALINLFEYLHSEPSADKSGRFEQESRYVAMILRPQQRPRFIELGSAAILNQIVQAGQAAKWELTVEEGPDQTPGQQFRRQVWDKLRPELGGAKLILVSPDSMLSFVPWGALPGDEPGTLLIEQYAFATVPIPQLLPRLLEEEPGRESGGHPSMLLVGNVNFQQLRPNEWRERFGTQLANVGLSQPESRMRGQFTRGCPAYPDLPGTKLEIESISLSFQNRFAGRRPLILEGDWASVEAFRELATDQQFLHLATHGFFEEALPEPEDTESERFFQGDLVDGTLRRGSHPGVQSGLVFAGANQAIDPLTEAPRVLTALDVAELNLQRLELAVLSACETGLGRTAGGEGLLGLQRSFQSAGAKTTITSLWKVDDATTQKLMTEFYANLWEKGMGKLEALRAAQLSMLQEARARAAISGVGRGGKDELGNQPTASEPATATQFWAAWVLSGDWR